jgi:putative MATE family efflux protein
MTKSEVLGTQPIGKLLAQQAIPASIGFAVMSMNMVVDTIFVGKYIGDLAISAISIVVPISFFMSSFGMSIGMGGASIISRALGENNKDRAQLSFNNQITLTAFFMALFLVLGFAFQSQIITLYGAKAGMLDLTNTYYEIVMLGIPFLTLSMMANNNLRAEGKPKVAMLALLIPSLLNMVLDWLFISQYGWGMEGAAWATTISYLATGAFMVFYFLRGKTELKIIPKLFKLDWKIVGQIFSVGSVSLIRQVAISILTIVLHAMLFSYGKEIEGLGGEAAIGVYAIITRISMFAFFPLIGIAQGFVPIAGYNYGAKKFDRVQEAVKISVKIGLYFGIGLCGLLLIFSESIPLLFAKDSSSVLIEYAPKAIFIIFLMTPIVIFQLIGASFYQALGRGKPALLLTLTKQLFFLTPFVLILPPLLGLEGIWWSFPIADVLSGLVCWYYLRKGVKKMLAESQQENETILT